MRKSSKKNRPWRWAALLSFLLVLSIGWIAFDDLFSPFGKPSVSVEIPNLCGLPSSGITYPDWAEVEHEYRYDAATPAGLVLSQSPRAGSYRKLTAQNPRVLISLVISLGEQSVTIPPLTGLDHRQAAASLRELGLSVKTRTETGAYPAGQVFATEPRAGMSVPIGTEVTLFVSAGAEQKSVTVPDLVGMSRGDALVKLWTAQLSVADVVEIESTAPVGTVVRQSHQPNTLVPAGTKLTLYISREEE